MELRLGFKPSEIGPVPNTWDVGVLERFWAVLDCKHTTAKFIASGIPVASIREVQSRFVDLTNAHHTTSYFYTLLTEGGRKPCPGDLILSRNATVGEIAQVAEWHPPFAMGQDVCLLRKRDAVLSSAFLQAVFQSNIVAGQLVNAMVGSTFKRVNVEQVKSLMVPMPPPEEQRAIAAALGDVDALLASLDKLIAKKRDLKQAAMQQLLTGKTRLPGFSEKWETRRLGSVAQLVGGGTPTTTVKAFWDGGIPWCTPTDITSTPGKYLTQTAKTISEAGLQSSAARLLPAGALLLCTRATLGELKIATREICTNQGFKSLIPVAGISNEFLYYKLQTMKAALVERATGSTFLEISKRDCAALELAVPPGSEQSAIASVLSELDAELVGLELRRDKTRAINQGMMQELLRGRTRLV